MSDPVKPSWTEYEPEDECGTVRVGRIGDRVYVERKGVVGGTKTYIMTVADAYAIAALLTAYADADRGGK